MTDDVRIAGRPCEFRLAFFDRVGLRTASSSALDELNALGAQGWHIVHIRDDPQHARDLAIFLERDLAPTIA